MKQRWHYCKYSSFNARVSFGNCAGVSMNIAVYTAFQQSALIKFSRKKEDKKDQFAVLILILRFKIMSTF